MSDRAKHRPGLLVGLVALSLIALLVGGLVVGWVGGPLPLTHKTTP